jgi:hypothetical protein
MRWLQIVLVFVIAVLVVLGAVGVNAFEHTTHTVNQLTTRVSVLESKLNGSQVAQLTKEITVLKTQEHQTQLYAQGLSTQLYQAEQSSQTFDNSLVNCIDQNQTIITNQIDYNNEGSEFGLPAISVADGTC